MPLISVLMGIYNEKKENAMQAIDSILCQTFQDFEFVICDDGSDDEYYLWLVSFCKKDVRIRLLRNAKNQGLSVALNRCLRHSSGSFLARMDADDISMPRRLEIQVSFLKKHGEYALVGSYVQMMDAHGVWGERRVETQPCAVSFLWTSPFVHPAVMFRREVLEELRGYCEASWAVRAEDYELFMRLYATGYAGYNIPKALLQYREDRDAYGRRKYRYRIHEAFVRWKGFRELGILKGNRRYVCKPLIAGSIPPKIMQMLRRSRYRIRPGREPAYPANAKKRYPGRYRVRPGRKPEYQKDGGCKG